jgi:hypothetical protein
MKMIGGPFKPFFGLSGVHFQVAGNHFRRSELGFNQYPVPQGRLGRHYQSRAEKEQ